MLKIMYQKNLFPKKIHFFQKQRQCFSHFRNFFNLKFVIDIKIINRSNSPVVLEEKFKSSKYKIL